MKDGLKPPIDCEKTFVSIGFCPSTGVIDSYWLQNVLDNPKEGFFFHVPSRTVTVGVGGRNLRSLKMSTLKATGSSRMLSVFLVGGLESWNFYLLNMVSG